MASKKNLVIVESPAKAKTITKYLNGNKTLTSKYGTFVVLSSYGHVRDLAKGQISIDIANGFEPTYQVSEDKKKIVSELQAKAAEANVVWLASDHDREGEGIAAHLKDVLKLKNYKRITFTEITPKALEQAVQNPRLIDNNLVDSQETRRLLDRIVGFKLSPLLWKKYRTNSAIGLSAGRVQSAVMHIILQREKEIDGFDSGAYWYYIGEFALTLGPKKIPLTECKLYKGTTVLKETSKINVITFFKHLKNKFKVTEFKNRESKKNADLPFITSSLQQEAHGKCGFTLKRTMQLAQELYEKGHITYMRTDSYNISEDFQAEAEKYITSTYGETYWNQGGSKKSRKKQKNAQEAHEAIRPTHVQMTSDGLKDFSADHKKLYDMIWKRTVAYFMPACVHDEIEIKFADVGSKSFEKDMHFISTFSRVKFNGYMIVYGIKNEHKEAGVFAQYIEALSSPSKHSIACKEIISKNTWNSPPARYNESSIIKALESEGIGRPSTYAGILTKLFDKQYILKSDIKGMEKPVLSYKYSANAGRLIEEAGTVTIGMERSKLVPTDIGKEIDTFLDENFSYITDKHFTANMEADLDGIAEGEKDKLDVLGGFWKIFGRDLEKFDGLKDKKVVLKMEGSTLEVDGVVYTVRLAKYGPVIESAGPDSKKNFINLKPYLKMMKKEMSDIDEDDIRLLKSFPKSLGNIENKEFVFVYGPYGFYGKYNDQNIKLMPKTVWSILKGEDDAMTCILANIDYHQKNKTGTAETTSSPGSLGKKSIAHKTSKQAITDNTDKTVKSVEKKSYKKKVAS